MQPRKICKPTDATVRGSALVYQYLFISLVDDVTLNLGLHQPCQPDQLHQMTILARLQRNPSYFWASQRKDLW